MAHPSLWQHCTQLSWLLLLFLLAGLAVTELLRHTTRNNLTVPLGVLPNYADLTIGGLLATGAHGIGGSGQANMVRLPLRCHTLRWHCLQSHQQGLLQR
jgi:hypothetical protein